MAEKEGMPKSREIASELREKILSGELGPGAILPSEREFVEHYNISKTTVPKIIAILRSEGLVETTTGRGTFVRRRQSIVRHGHDRYARRHRNAGKPPFRQEVEAQGRTPRVDVNIIRVAATPDWVADRLQISPTALTLQRSNTYLVDNQPIQIVTTYIPENIAAGTTLETDVPAPGGIYAALDELGYTLTRMTEEIEARLASPTEQNALDLDAGNPVLDVIHVSYDQNNTPIDVSRFILNGYRNRLTYELPTS